MVDQEITIQITTHDFIANKKTPFFPSRSVDKQ